MTDIVERLRDVAIETDCDAVANDAIAEIERLRKRERRLAARVKQLHDIIQADRGPDFYIPAPDEPTA